MKVEISYTVYDVCFGGQNLVTFEELYDFSNPDEPVKVANIKTLTTTGRPFLSQSVSSKFIRLLPIRTATKSLKLEKM